MKWSPRTGNAKSQTKMTARTRTLAVLLSFILALNAAIGLLSFSGVAPPPGSVWINGYVYDANGDPINDLEVKVYVNGVYKGSNHTYYAGYYRLGISSDDADLFDGSPVLVTAELDIYNDANSTPFDDSKSVITQDLHLKFSVPLSNGWNLITIPLQNDITTASDLGFDISECAGCTVSEINKWTNKYWTPWIAEIPSINDFLVSPGESYFIKINGSGGDWTANGSKFPAPVQLTLGHGWNLIGIPNCTSSLATASDVLEQLDTDFGAGTSEMIANWTGSYWDIRCGMAGIDFQLADRDHVNKAMSRGWFLYVNKDVVWTPH